MNVQDFFIVWQDIGLILYSVLKAFLPLPSLEVILVPLVLHTPEKWLLYSLEGAIGTCIGGAIGYGIARMLGKKVLYNIAAKEDVAHGEELMERYGLLAVFIGGITPIPDFLLAYLAGFTSMRLVPFL
ncbi:MAG: YqaA family protein [Clostridium sp.]